MRRLTGNRHFTWFQPAGRRPTQYEAYSVGQQSNPSEWLHVDYEPQLAPFYEPCGFRPTAAGLMS